MITFKQKLGCAVLLSMGFVACNTGDTVERPAELTVTPEVKFVAFDKVPLNQTTTQTVVITNVGGSPAKITDVQLIEGDADAEPELQQGTGWQTQWVLEPQQKATFEIVWSPKNKTDDSGQLVIKTDSPENATITIDLETPEPEGDALSLSVDPAIVDFGLVGPGSISERTVTVSIAGDEQVNITGTRIDGTSSAEGELTIKTQPEWPKTFVKDEDFEIVLSYSPKDLSEDTLELVIIYDGGEISVPLKSTLSALVYETRVDFGPKAKGQSFNQLIYLENKSDQVWTIGEAFVQYDKGEGAFDYSFPDPGDVDNLDADRPKGELPLDIAAGDKLPIRLIFMPGDSVDYSAMFKISGPVEPKKVDIQLVGSGM